MVKHVVYAFEQISGLFKIWTVSTVNTYNYNLACYLVDILQQSNTRLNFFQFYRLLQNVENIAMK